MDNICTSQINSSRITLFVLRAICYMALFSVKLVSSIAASNVTVKNFAGENAVSGSTNGVGTMARFSAPSRNVLSPDDTLLYVLDFQNYKLRKKY